jgi:hypothetical protein
VDNVSTVLARLGTVKNPVLFSSSSFSGLMMYLSPNVEQGYHFHIFLLAVAVFLMGLAFYVYGFVRLPSSTQELLFLQEATIAVERHHAKAAQTRRRVKADA